MVASVGDTATESSACVTVTAAVPETPPDAAVIVAVPLATAVTSTAASTVATDAAGLDHATAAPAITLPLWSRTSAVS